MPKADFDISPPPDLALLFLEDFMILLMDLFSAG